MCGQVLKEWINVNYLILEDKSSKGPNSCKHKVQFIHILGSVRGGVFGSEESLQQVAQCLDHAHFLHRCDLLELARPNVVQEDRDILVKQDGQVRPF